MHFWLAEYFFFLRKMFFFRLHSVSGQKSFFPLFFCVSPIRRQRRIPKKKVENVQWPTFIYWEMNQVCVLTRLTRTRQSRNSDKIISDIQKKERRERGYFISQSLYNVILSSMNYWSGIWIMQCKNGDARMVGGGLIFDYMTYNWQGSTCLSVFIKF